MRARETDRERSARRSPGALARLLAALGRVIRLLLLSLLVSIFVEWIGMTWWWPEQGVDHSRTMLQAEIEYLETNMQRSLVSANPAAYVQSVASTTYDTLFVKTRLIWLIDWLGRSTGPASSGRSLFGTFISAAHAYVLAAMNIVQVFAARVAVLCLAAPLFVLVTLLALVDGLVQRDLRRWGGGRESSYLYHYAKRSNGALLISACIVYLALPFSVPPIMVILPFAVLFGLSVSITASMFKKYL